MFACTLQIVALLFVLSDSVPASVQDGVAGFDIILLGDGAGSAWATAAARQVRLAGDGTIG
jgi:hypothetical protein